MQTINELSIRTAVAIESLKLQARDRIVEAQEGQTAVEYAGILALIATIFVLLFGLGLDETIKGVVDDAVKAITNKD
jgi:Flp pilus assembly pilin Flp